MNEFEQFAKGVSAKLDDLEVIMDQRFEEIKKFDYKKPKCFTFSSVVQAISYCDSWLNTVGNYKTIMGSMLNIIAGLIQESNAYYKFSKSDLELNADEDTVSGRRARAELTTIPIFKVIGRAQNFKNITNGMKDRVKNIHSQIQRDRRDLYCRRDDYTSGMGAAIDKATEESEGYGNTI